MATSKDRLDDVIVIVKDCGYICNRETVGVAVKKLTKYRNAAEQGIGEVAFHLKTGDTRAANKAMDLMLIAIDAADNT